MAIKTTLICGNDSETAVYAVCYSEGLSLTFQFDRDIRYPSSLNSRVVNCFHQVEVKDPETCQDAESMREVIRSSISHVWPFCAVDPTVHLPDVVIHIHQDIHSELIWRISHESTFQNYIEALLSAESVQASVILHSGIECSWISHDSLQFTDVLGGRGSSTLVRLRRTQGKYVYKGLSFRLFLESSSIFQHERDAFYHELNVIFRLPDHPNLLHPPLMLITTDIVGGCAEESKRRVCGALYPYLERQSLQEVIEKAEVDRVRFPLQLQAKWAYQISSAMTAVHLAQQYHMDLKPSNILLDEQDNVLLIDWEQLGASPFFLAPEANGAYDVELGSLDRAIGANLEGGKLCYNEYTGSPVENSWAWPHRNVFPIWQSDCPRALEAAEVYSLGRTLWVMLEQIDEDSVESHRSDSGPEFNALRWRGNDIPQHWKDFITRSTSQDPNERGRFNDAVKFWRNEFEALNDVPQ